MQINKNLLTTAVLTIGGFAAVSANAVETVTSNFDVAMEVKSICTVAAGPTINLGAIDAGTEAPEVGSSTFNVACSKTTPFIISMLPSGADSSGIGSMKSNNPLNTDTIAYKLTTDAVGDTTWTGDNKKSGVGEGTTTNLPFEVYAKVTTEDFLTVQPDTYSETVTVSVAY